MAADNSQQNRSGSVRNILRGMFEGLVMISVIGAGWMGLDKLQQPDTLPITQVDIHGRFKNLTAATMKKQIAAHTSAGFFSVDLQTIETALEQLHWVDTAAVRRRWPDKLRVSVREQVPVARWGEDGLVNARGDVFKPPRLDWPPGLPVLYGPEGRERAMIRHYHQANKLLRSLGLRAHALVQDERRAWLLLLDNGVPVALGRGDPQRNLNRLSRVYPRVLAPRAGQLAAIDFRYTNGFSVAWKEAAQPSSHVILNQSVANQATSNSAVSTERYE